MGDMKVNGSQSAQQLDKDIKQAGKEAISNVKSIRNIAAGVAVAGAAAMGAEALGVLTIPAMIPTATVTVVAGGVAGVFGIIGAISDSVDKLITSADQQREKQLKGN